MSGSWLKKKLSITDTDVQKKTTADKEKRKFQDDTYIFNNWNTVFTRLYEADLSRFKISIGVR
jgi:hypothetical protein